MGNFGGMNRDTMQSLQMMLHACNPYAIIYQTVAKRLQGGVIELSFHLVNDCRTNLRRYNALTVDKVGTLMVGGDVDEVDVRDIVVHSINGYFQRVSPFHSAYAPLHLSQPHFGISVRMKFTLPKVGSWSPSGLSKTQNSSSRVKTPRIEVFFISMERS
jgi:hypothetical protein